MHPDCSAMKAAAAEVGEEKALETDCCLHSWTTADLAVV